MTALLRDLLAGIGVITIVWLAAACLGSYMDKRLPDRVPRPNVRSQRYSPNAQSRWWV